MRLHYWLQHIKWSGNETTLRLQHIKWSGNETTLLTATHQMVWERDYIIDTATYQMVWEWDYTATRQMVWEWDYITDTATRQMVWEWDYITDTATHQMVWEWDYIINTYLWPPKISHGVRVRFTLARWFSRNLYCGEPCVKLCSVLMSTKWTLP